MSELQMTSVKKLGLRVPSLLVNALTVLCHFLSSNCPIVLSLFYANMRQATWPQSNFYSNYNGLFLMEGYLCLLFPAKEALARLILLNKIGLKRMAGSQGPMSGLNSCPQDLFHLPFLQSRLTAFMAQQISHRLCIYVGTRLHHMQLSCSMKRILRTHKEDSALLFSI